MVLVIGLNLVQHVSNL